MAGIRVVIVYDLYRVCEMRVCGVGVWVVCIHVVFGGRGRKVSIYRHHHSDVYSISLYLNRTVLLARSQVSLYRSLMGGDVEEESEARFFVHLTSPHICASVRVFDRTLITGAESRGVGSRGGCGLWSSLWVME